jgi:serine/threonine protein kinase
MCAQVDASLAHLIQLLLEYDADMRLSAAAALLHPFFDALSPMRALAQVH